MINCSKFKQRICSVIGTLNQIMKLDVRAFLPPILLLILVCNDTQAVEYVTWDGGDGVGGRIFTGSGTQKCRYCHESGNQASFWGDTVPTLNSYATVTSGSNASDSNTRIQAQTMPRADNATDYAPLSATLRTLMQDWINDGTPQNALPHAETFSEQSVGKYSATLRGRYNENGLTSTFRFRYGTSSLNPASNSTTFSPSGTGGGGTASGAIQSYSATGLSCGTTYYYRFVGLRSNVIVSGNTFGNNESFVTDACNATPTFFLSSVNVGATEDMAFSYTPFVTNDAEGTPSYRFHPSDAGLIPAGASINSVTGEVTWTPVEGQGSASFRIQVTDNGPDSPGYNDQTVNITVTAVNDSPSMGALPASIAGAEEQAITPVQATVSDPDDTNNGSDLSWSLSNEPGGMTISTTGLISWTPQEGFTGPQTVTVQVCDDGVPVLPIQCDSDTFSASAVAENDTPDLTAIPNQNIDEDSLWTYQTNFTDPDFGDSHSYQLSSVNGVPTGMTISTTGLISWTPDDEHLPSANNIEVTITDSAFASDTEEFSISINSVNDQPLLDNILDQDVFEGDLFSYQVGVTDQDDTDWPNDLRFYLLDEPAGMSIDENGLITWQTAEEDPSPGLISVGVRDGGEDGTVAHQRRLDINVIAYNYQPVITSTADATATEDIEYTYQLVIDDVDDPNDGSGALSFALSNEPTGMTISNTGLISWTPTEGVSTSGTVTVSVQDGGEDATVAATEDFTLSVTAVNDAPSITSTAPNSIIEMNTWTYQVTVSDPDDLDVSDFTFSLINEPQGMTIDDTGFVSWYAPEAAGTSGDFTIVVADGGEDAAAAASENVNITVIVFNTPPIITSQASTSASEDLEYQYQATVDDVDDANNGLDLLWSLSNAPTGMTVNSTGLVTWTPTEGTTSSGLVTLTVADGGEDAAPTFSENFTVNVIAVNDAPQITSTPPSSVIQNTNLAYQLTVVDPDDSNNGSSLLFSLSGQPPGMLISNTGLLTWTPDESSPQTNNITITVSDGGEDGAQAATQNFLLTVVFDIDQDGVENSMDNCESIPNADQANNDGDDFGDVCDFDDDNDGMSDVYEIANGFDPTNPADGAEDADGDGLSNLEEFQQGSNPFGDDNPPRITLPLNNLWISTGYHTWVSIGEAVATDSLGGPVPVTPSRQSGAFRPGRHEIIWTATDANNNTATATQVIRVLPLIGLAASQVTGEGKTINVVLTLNGDPPEQPATVNYQVSGNTDSNDHDAVNGSLEFTNRRAELPIEIFQDDVTEGEERFLIRLSSPINAALAGNFAQEIIIVENNLAPSLTLQVMQGGESGSIVNRVEGNVIINAIIEDPNANDSFSYDWSMTDNALVAINNSGTTNSASFEFDPTSVATQLYPVVLTVTDSGGLSASEEILLSVQSSTQIQDQNNNGVIDSNDAVDVASALQSGVGPVLESEAHITMSAGKTARYVGTNGAALTTQDVQNFGNNGFQAANALTNFQFSNGLYDFALSGLQEGEDVNVLLAQTSALSIGGNILHYQSDSGWQQFEVDELNKISSAPALDGVCPAMDDLEYEEGLVEGNECVLLTIEDGGPNDGDQQVNGKVTFLGGVGNDGSQSGSDNNGGNDSQDEGGNAGGSGSIDYLFALLFLFVCAISYNQKRSAFNKLVKLI